MLQWRHMKIALVHDDFLQWGGAERVVQAISEIWPKAPIYTSVVDQKLIAERFPKRTIIQSWLKHVPLTKQLRRPLLPFYPLAFQSLDVADTDVVLSSTTRFAHTIRYNGALHVSYCHTPPRFLWQEQQYFSREKHNNLLQSLAKPMLTSLRTSDAKSEHNVALWIANSKNVAQRIKRIYHRNAHIIYPFVDTNQFLPKKSKPSLDYFLVVTRLLPWKRVDIAIEACKKLQCTLIIIGKGPDKTRLKKIATGSKTVFLENLTDHELMTYYQNAKALLITQEEDFGLTSLEAQACGRPVVAYGRGGALETVAAGSTGVFYTKQTALALSAALKVFDASFFTTIDCRHHASQFSKERFQSSLKQYIVKSAAEN